uniref:Uncharacterized protein n=1 Tax=viral metagenome TaxID=1070528 RepID=A0A6C0B2I1_9ZZZZ
MFAQDVSNTPVMETPTLPEQNTKYKNVLSNPGTSTVNEMNYNTIDALLELEKQNNKNENWNKLEKSLKIQKLHVFAEKYGRENSMPVKDIKLLKTFFIDCLEKNKLQKTKDVTYDKESKEIINIPALHFNVTNRNFTLKIVDTKRVSTLKSLTPKRIEETPSKNE